MGATEAEYQFSQLLTLIDPKNEIEKKCLYTGLKELAAAIERIERQMVHLKSAVRGLNR
jgi:hypothetical protein